MASSVEAVQRRNSVVRDTLVSGFDPLKLCFIAAFGVWVNLLYLLSVGPLDGVAVRARFETEQPVILRAGA